MSKKIFLGFLVLLIVLSGCSFKVAGSGVYDTTLAIDKSLDNTNYIINICEDLANDCEVMEHGSLTSWNTIDDAAEHIVNRHCGDSTEDCTRISDMTFRVSAQNL